MAREFGVRSEMSEPEEEEAAGGSTPVADRIRERIRKAGARFRANDNIAAFVEKGELELLQAEVAEKIDAVLKSLVIDTTTDHNTQDTARRVAKITDIEKRYLRSGVEP